MDVRFSDGKKTFDLEIFTPEKPCRALPPPPPPTAIIVAEISNKTCITIF
jgi:hypothetical protein